MEFNNQRKAYGAALMDLGEGNPDVVVLDADLGNSTMSRQFQDKYPQRYFEMGICGGGHDLHRRRSGRLPARSPLPIPSRSFPAAVLLTRSGRP